MTEYKYCITIKRRVNNFYVKEDKIESKNIQEIIDILMNKYSDKNDKKIPILWRIDEGFKRMEELLLMDKK